MNSNRTTILIFRLYRINLSIATKNNIKAEFMRWRYENNWPRVCHICNKYIQKKDISVDHLIPQSICFIIERPQLILDPRNFAVAHIKCNIKRGNSLACLPLELQTKIKTMLDVM